MPGYKGYEPALCAVYMQWLEGYKKGITSQPCLFMYAVINAREWCD
ncbi:hypothetical protein W04_1167 [Pseudoalteromonas sp. SW0106-04]|nr:hypothetical protein W04_1167 [Pseudoalteromonas sp. SW0106-04]